MLRVTVEGVRAPDISTRLRISPNKWDSGKQKAKGTGQAVQTINQQLTEIRNRINNIYLTLEKERKPYTAQMIIAIYKGGYRTDATLVEAYEQYIKHLYSLHGTDKELKEKTIKHYEHCLMNVEKFLAYKNKKHLLAQEFNTQVANQFFNYCNTVLKHSNNHTVRLLNKINRALKYCHNEGVIKRMPSLVIEHKKSRRKQPIVYLTKQELDQWQRAEMPHESLDVYRDIFTLQCYTSMAYADVMSFDPEKHIVIRDGRECIKRERKKGHHRGYTLILLQAAKDILEKYDYQIPHRKNSYYNEMLKIVAAIVGIKDKNITTHVARKTFAVMALNTWGLSLSTVAACMGHSSTTTTEKYYVDVLDEKVYRDMAHLE